MKKTVVMYSVVVSCIGLASCMLTANRWCVATPCGRRGACENREIECHCPCDRYPQLPKRNACSRCFHAHRPEVAGGAA